MAVTSCSPPLDLTSASLPMEITLSTPLASSRLSVPIETISLPSSTPQTNMPELPMNPMQMVTGKDGKKYQIVIDPSTGLQTFIPYREPAGRGMGQMRGMGEMPGMLGQGSRMERIQRLARRMGQMEGQNPTNRLSSLLSASG